MSGPSSSPRPEHSPRPGVTWNTELVRVEQLVDDDAPDPTPPNRKTRRAMKRAAVTAPASDRCGLPHYTYPESLCTEPSGHYRPISDPHAALLIIDGRECGAVAWDEPKEQP